MKKSITGSLLAILILIFGQIVTYLATNWLENQVLQHLLTALLYPLACLTLLHRLARSYLQQPLYFLFGKGKLQGLWLGMGILLLLLIIGFYWGIGGKWQIHLEEQVLDKLVYAVLVGGLSVGLVKEVIFRGFLQELFQQTAGKLASCIIPSFIFAALHLLNGGLSLLTAVLLLIAGTSVGVMFALVRLESESLLNSWILHALWNSMTGILFIGNVARTDYLLNLLIPQTSPFLTGGQYGIDISLPAILGYLLLAGIAYYRQMKKKAS